jgi:hypothetical protein
MDSLNLIKFFPFPLFVCLSREPLCSLSASCLTDAELVEPEPSRRRAAVRITLFTLFSS